MRIQIMKFGGTSLSSQELRRTAAANIREALERGLTPVVVVSAFGREGDPYATDTLLGLAGNQEVRISAREVALLASCGEVIASVVMAETLQQAGVNAVALTGGQAGIVTTDCHVGADIAFVERAKLADLLSAGKVPVVAGFQGRTRGGELSVLERGGSDISSTALGHFLQAEGVDIFTDVPGVMTADPKVVPGARPFKELSFGHAHRLSAYGAKVMHPRAFDWAKRSPTPIFVRSIHDAQSHTRIDDRGAAPSGESAFMGIACRTTDRRRHAVITLVGWGAIDGAASAAFVRDGLQRAGLSYADLEVFADAVAVTVRLALVQEAAHFLHSLCLNQQAEGWAFFEHRLEKSAIPSDAFLKLAQS